MSMATMNQQRSPRHLSTKEKGLRIEPNYRPNPMFDMRAIENQQAVTSKVASKRPGHQLSFPVSPEGRTENQLSVASKALHGYKVSSATTTNSILSPNSTAAVTV